MKVKKISDELQDLYYIDDIINNYSRHDMVNRVVKLLDGHKSEFFPLDSKGVFHIYDVKNTQSLNHILIKMGLITKIIKKDEIQVYNPGLNTIFLEANLKI